MIVGQEFDAERMHRTMSLFFCNVLFLRMVAVSAVPDTIYRHRSMGLLAALWRAMLPFVALRRRSCVVILSLMSMLEIATTGFNMWIWNETGIFRCVNFLLVTSVATVCWTYAVTSLFYTL